MALRFQCKGAQVVQTGTVFTHGIFHPARGAIVPDEWSACLAGPTPGGVALYRVGLPTTSQMTWAASGATSTGDIFIAANHSIMQ